MGVAVEKEDQSIANGIAYISNHLSDSSQKNTVPYSSNYRIHQAGSSLTVRSGIGRWIRQEITHAGSPLSIPSGVSRDVSSEPDSRSLLTVNVSKFHYLCHILEDLEDFSILADVLSGLTNSQDSQLLEAIVVTINHYFDVFHAIGAADPLFERLMQQHRTLPDNQNVQASLLESLIDLGNLTQNHLSETRTLLKQLQRCNRRSSGLVASPISEQFSEFSPSPNMISVDGLEQILVSGTTMDTKVLAHFFEKIWKILESSWAESVQSSCASAGFITKLRPLNPHLVDHLITLWLDKSLESSFRPSVVVISLPLICANVVSLDHFLDRVLQLLRTSPHEAFREKLALETLELLSLGRDRSQHSAAYVCFTEFEHNSHNLLLLEILSFLHPATARNPREPFQAITAAPNHL